MLDTTGLISLLVLIAFALILGIRIGVAIGVARERREIQAILDMGGGDETEALHEKIQQRRRRTDQALPL